MTKIEEISEIVRICEQERQTGDYQTLAKALGTTVDAARMRYYRKDEQAVKILYRIIKQREELTLEISNK
ncbi:hypothetical protein [Riemerella anatipestifer]|uniref:Uncharacterized protein n=2 Tax=Riemerella anatipestifer TaxID=34085 RepID=J9RA46_RIEAN|nr:hypothetical protein [Riemerella anatipestifer]AFR36582.1 hypothetical protein B739_2000 [Riemerella anatipestifer RA-CH-1]AIH01377.1 hypothetical protein M949_0206 [Riemerella anatipestifer CH3]MBT0573823.1 hypothetical protein [Riemerella anatipestifer]MCO7331385.1 hypothetical protein [Riemerella anatipestifer]MCO7350144.1 hypothetical protein [Riemerella anatipestifer]